MSEAELSAKAPEIRRERILRAAVEVIRERGFSGARVADIAEAAGTSQGLVLYHFGSLAQVLAQALTLLEDEYYDELDLETPLGTPLERLRLIALSLPGRGPTVGEWRLWLEIWVHALRDDDARATRETLDRRWRASLRALVTQGVESGDFHPIDIDASVARLTALMDGLAIQLALDDPSMSPELFTELWWRAACSELRVERD